MGKMFSKDGRVFPSAGDAKKNRKDGKEKPINNEAVEIGTIPEQGKRNDLRGFDADIKAGKRGRDLSVVHLDI